MITINGEQKPLLGHINEALLSETKDLRLVDFARVTPEGFIVVAQGKPNLSKEDLDNVSSGNFVHVPAYNQAKRNDGQGIYETVDAIVLGTQDEKQAHRIHFAALHNILDAARK